MMSKEKRRVPKLRFPGFTGDWEQRKLGECMDSFEYGLNAAAKEYDGMHKYIRITDIDDETHNFIQSNLTSPDIDFNSDVSDYKLNINDIVFARTGASVGKTYLYNPNDGDLYYAGFLIRGKVNEACDAGFIYQNTLTKDYDSFIRITSQRSGQPGVNSKEYATFRLNIPCKDEQEKISNFLNSLDKLFTLHQRKLDNLKLRKKALLQKLFPKNGERYPELRFPGFTDAWEQRKLGDLLILLKDGSHGTHKNTDAGVYLLSAKNIKNGRINIMPDDRIISWDDYNVIHKNYELQIGDILLTIVGSIGETAIFNLKTKVTFQRSVAFLRPNSNLNNGFLYTLINTDRFQNQLQTKQVVSAQPGIYLGDLATIDITYPKNILEQEKIYNIFREIENSITLHQRKLDHLQLQKKALLQQMFV